VIRIFKDETYRQTCLFIFCPHFIHFLQNETKIASALKPVKYPWCRRGEASLCLYNEIPENVLSIKTTRVILPKQVQKHSSRLSQAACIKVRSVQSLVRKLLQAF